MFAYIVLSYDKPALISRLLHRIRALSPDAVIVLRHDKRRCLPPSDLPTGVHLGHDGPVQWGHWTMVEAVLRELAWVTGNTVSTHAVIISGQDYPTMHLGAWEEHVRYLDALIEASKLEFRPRWGRRRGYDGDETMVRYAYRWFAIPGSARWTYESWASRLLERACSRVASYVRPALYYRVLPRDRGTFVGIRRKWDAPTYKGGPWMMLSRRAICHLLAQDMSRFKRALVPEEAAIHSAVMTNPHLNIKLANLTYASWTGRLNHPHVLTRADLDAIEASGSPFARKVELSLILNDLDALSATSR